MATIAVPWILVDTYPPLLRNGRSTPSLDLVEKELSAPLLGRPTVGNTTGSVPVLTLLAAGSAVDVREELSRSDISSDGEPILRTSLCCINNSVFRRGLETRDKGEDEAARMRWSTRCSVQYWSLGLSASRLHHTVSPAGQAEVGSNGDGRVIVGSAALSRALITCSDSA